MAESNRVTQIRNKLRESLAAKNGGLPAHSKLTDVESISPSSEFSGSSEISTTDMPKDKSQANGAFPAMNTDEVFGVFDINEVDEHPFEDTPTSNTSSNEQPLFLDTPTASTPPQKKAIKVDPPRNTSPTITYNTTQANQSNDDMTTQISNLTTPNEEFNSKPLEKTNPTSRRTASTSRRHVLPSGGKAASVRMVIPQDIDDIDAGDPATVLKNLHVNIEKERHMHKLAGLHLRAVNNWLLFLPAIIITLTSGMLALIAETDLKLSELKRVILSVIVGVMALLAALWQALAKQLDLGSRAALHEATSIALKRLIEDILLRISSNEPVPIEYVIRINEKFCQALETCGRSVIPYRIEAAFDAVQDRMVLILRPPTSRQHRQFSKEDYMQLYATLYDELSSEIIHHWKWPFFLPQPRAAAENAIKSFKEVITEGREISRGISVFGTTKKELSLFEILPPVEVDSRRSRHALGQESTNISPFMV